MNINCQPPLQFVYFSTDTHIPWISHNTLRDRLFKNGVATRKKVYCDQLWCSPRKPYQRSSLPSFTCLNFLSFYPTLVDLSSLTISWSTLNPLTKSVRVLFERKKINRLKPQDVTYNGQVIPSSSTDKFLGITFDSALIFRFRFRTVATLARHRLYISYTRSLFEYGAPAICVASPAIQFSGGEDTNSFYFASTFHPILHPQRQKTAARLPSTHPSMTETFT